MGADAAQSMRGYSTVDQVSQHRDITSRCSPSMQPTGKILYALHTPSSKRLCGSLRIVALSAHHDNLGVLAKLCSPHPYFPDSVCHLHDGHAPCRAGA